MTPSWYAQLRDRVRPARDFSSMPLPQGADSDYAFVHLVAQTFGRRLAYVQGRRWMVCDDELVWHPAGEEQVRQVVRDLTGVEANRKVAAVEQMLRGYCSVQAEVFEEDPLVLHLAGGKVLVLGTDHVRDAQPEDYCQWTTGIEYDPSATYRPWQEFLHWVLPDPDVRDWVQRWFGYCLGSSVQEEKVLLLHGDGGDGKSTLLEAVAGVLGRYSTSGVAPDLVLRGGRADHPTEVARLAGRRLVWINELPDDATLDEGKLKRLVSTGSVSARFIARDYVDVPVTWKLVVTTNVMPDVAGQNLGTWRRLVPLKLRSLQELYVSGQVIADPDTGERHELKVLLATDEAKSAILAWLNAGYKAWLAEPLSYAPAKLHAERDEYRSAEDQVELFADAHLVLDPTGTLTAGRLQELLRRYRSRGVTRKTVGQWLEAHGAQYVRHVDGSATGKKGWRGVREVGVNLPV